MPDKSKSLVLILLILLMMDYSLVWSFDEIRISNDPDAKIAINPDIYGNTVVWEDQRNGSIYGWNRCINVYDLVTKTESTIYTSTNYSYVFYPQIYDNYIVWQDQRSGPGTSAIYGYDFSSNSEFKITDTGSSPSIYGNTVTFGSAGAVYGYNLDTKTGFTISSSTGNSSIYGNTVVYGDYRGGNYGIYGYDLSTGEEFTVSSSASYKFGPIISGNTVVWKDYRNGNQDIYAYDLATNTEFPISTETVITEIDPAIYGNIVVWSEWNDDPIQEDLKIYGYNTSTGTKFLISDNQGSFTEGLADIYGSIVVWQDCRTGDMEIYYADISSAVPEPSTIVLLIAGLAGVVGAIKSYQKAIK